MGMRGTLSICTAVLLICLCSTAFAGYADNITRKVDRGFSNALGCWLEIPYQTYAVAKDKGIAAGAPMGFGKGLVMMPLRLLSGVADIATFPVACPMTGWEGFIKPEYNPWVEEPEKPLPAQPVAEPPAVGQPVTEGLPAEAK
jgi:putative exosortase-associated protein (TIGR04073 family)